MSEINVLIVDDHELFRKGIIELLRDVPEIKIISEAETGNKALELIEKKQPDVALLDLHLPDIGGVELTQRIKQNHPEINIMILSGYCSPKEIHEVIQAGSSGYLLKKSGKSQLVNAIKVAAEGNFYYSKEAAEKVFSSMSMVCDPGDNDYRGSLSPREKEVVQLICKGMTNNEIAEKLYVSCHTIVTHRRNIFQKTHVRNTAGLVKFASEHGLL